MQAPEGRDLGGGSRYIALETVGELAGHPAAILVI